MLKLQSDDLTCLLIFLVSVLVFIALDIDIILRSFRSSLQSFTEVTETPTIDSHSQTEHHPHTSEVDEEIDFEEEAKPKKPLHKTMWG